MQTPETATVLELYCQKSTVRIGTLVLDPNCCNLTPMVAAWNDTILVHPVLALSPVRALAHLRTCNERISYSESESDDEELVTANAADFEALQLAYLSCLQTFCNFNLSVPGLPPLREVLETVNRLESIAGAVLRFKLNPANCFPRVNYNPSDASLIDLLKLCQTKILVATRRIEEIAEEEEQLAQLRESAVTSIRRPSRISRKHIYNWMVSYFPESVDRSLIKKLYNLQESDINKYSRDDINYFRECFERYCPAGTPLQFELRKIADRLAGYYQDYFKTFVIESIDEESSDEPAELPAEQTNSSNATVEPQESDYPSRVQFIVAHAKWRMYQAKPAQPVPAKHSVLPNAPF